MSLKVNLKEALPLANKFLDFVNSAVSPWHAVHEIKTKLLNKGFVQLHEKETWDLKPNGQYFVTRNQSSIVTFSVGGQYKAGNGFKIIGAHTDSPDLKVKPISAQTKEQYFQIGVQTYGGGLWYSWFDRDLTVAGRVIVQNPEKKGSFESKLVHIKKPILKIPSLAIHLNRGVNESGFKFNEETNLVPILSSVIADQLSGRPTTDTSVVESSTSMPPSIVEDDKVTSNTRNKKNEEPHHHGLLLEMLAKELGGNYAAKDILDFELSVVDTQNAVIGGGNDEFIFSPRLDNLMSCFCGLEGYLDCLESLKDDMDIRLLCCFDHEEIGSKSSHGAGGTLLSDVVRRIHSLFGHAASIGDGDGRILKADSFECCMAKSFIISSDMAHAVHPNYADKHQEKHKPLLHRGPVIKVNANQRYATTSTSSFLFKELCQRSGVPYQEFCVRNDSPCGSTIGPILASGLGVRTVDIGNPMWAMHSIRETCGTVDVVHATRLFKKFYESMLCDFDNVNEF